MTTTGLVLLCLMCGSVNDQARPPAFCRECGTPMVLGRRCRSRELDPAGEWTAKACDDVLLGPTQAHWWKLSHLGPPRVLVAAVLAALLVVSPAAAADTGYASHYGPGNGVAMPFCTWTVRHSTGCGWVAITSLQTGIRVVTPVVDYCACVVPGSSQPVRLVDLQYDVVDALGLNWEAGLYHVRVERLGGDVLPNTAVTP